MKCNCHNCQIKSKVKYNGYSCGFWELITLGHKSIKYIFYFNSKDTLYLNMIATYHIYFYSSTGIDWSRSCDNKRFTRPAQGHFDDNMTPSDIRKYWANIQNGH